MTDDRTLERAARSWIEAGPTRAPDHAVEAALLLIQTTPQERRLLAPWRSNTMPTFARVAAAAAIGVLVLGGALMAFNGSGPSTGGPPSASAASPSPLSSAPPSPSPSRPVAPTGRGVLDIGRHEAEYAGVRFSFAIPADGWSAEDRANPLVIETYKDGSHTWLSFWSPENVYADACARTAREPAPGPSAAALAQAMTEIVGTHVVDHTDVTVGGFPASQVTLTVREDAPCRPPAFYLWYDDDEQIERYASRSTSTERIWIVDVDGTRFAVDSEQDSPGAEMEHEVQQIVDSIIFAEP